MNKVVFLVAGGTGGHVFPAISLAKSLKNAKPFFLTDKRTENLFLKEKLNYFLISSSRIKKNIFKFPLIFLKIFLGILYSMFLIIVKNPRIVIGFGGYTSIPTIIAAKILNKKIIIHEQNSIMGKTNRILSKIANITAISYEKTKFAPESAILSGIPIRAAKKYKKKKSSKKYILIIGGSQGAKYFSELIFQILEQLEKRTLKKIFIIHQAPQEDITKIKKIYHKFKVNFKVMSFFHNIYDEIYNADLIISRCGASTLAEIEYFNKFSILFPLPTSADNHQYYNAHEFQKRNKCEIIDQSNFNVKKISLLIEKIFFSKSFKQCSKTKKTKKKSLDLIINNMLG